MPDATSLQPGDPAQVAGYRILDRLGAGGQGVVYLAASSGGNQVAVKVLRRTGDPDEDAQFRREAEVLPQIASFCTAQVLEVGTAGEMPYIVSEYIEGPTLQEALATRGPLRGHELRRVAVGTVTALAAIHRAGVVHRDFKPSNVLLSRDGPRVIDFGIARAVDAEIHEEGIVGTPSYMAPEHMGDGPPGPPADLFAWGSVMVFAASGHPPFGSDTLPAIMRRIVFEEPDLGALDGDLREIVAECLAKDPAVRPQAGQVLFRLLGHAEGAPPPGIPQTTYPGMTTGAIGAGSGVGAGAGSGIGAGAADGAPAGAATDRPQGGRLRRGRTRPIIAVGSAVTLAAAVTAFVLTRSSARDAVTGAGSTPTGSAGPISSAGSGRASSSPRASIPQPTHNGTIKVPELRATLHERASDPVRITSFIVRQSAMRYPGYVRVPGGTEFRRIPEQRIPLVSPDGATIAAIYQTPEFVAENNNMAWFTDRAGGGAFSVDTVKPPLYVTSPQWSRDSRRLLLTVYRDAKTGLADQSAKRTAGFVIVDVAARTSSFTPLDKGQTGNLPFFWGPDGTSLIRRTGATTDGIRFFGLDGKVRRTMKNVRWPGPDDMFSPSGRQLASLCPGDTLAACVLDVRTGQRRAGFTLPAQGALWGWFDERHLLVFDRTRWKTSIVDLNGRSVRTFAQFSKDTAWQLFFGRN